MTNETGSAQNTTRPAATESKHAKGKSGDAHGHGAGGVGGFMAILASLDTSELAVSGATTLVDVALPGNGAAATALAAMARTAGTLKGARQHGATDSAGLDKTGDAVDGADLAAAEVDIGKFLQSSAAAVAAALPTPTEINLQTEVPLDTSALLAQAAQWSAVPAANAEPANPAGVASNLAGAAKLPHVPAKPEGATALSAVSGDAALESAGKTGKAQKDVFARLASAQAALTVAADASNPAMDPRQAQMVQKVAETPLTPIAAALAVANTVTPIRREDAMRERSVFRSNASESSAPSQSYVPSASGASAPSAPDPVTSTDTYVAEKVAYWISNDVQNAEMKLDGIGEKPVEVSIRMQGNEAHIAFRSDELQARAALENASLHLKDMLQREGLVLSGVSVGTSGTGDSGEQERKSRQGARQSGVASVQPARGDRAAGSGRVAGGALDLFV